MAFTIEFDDNNLIEKISDAYLHISEIHPLGMSFADFLSLEGDFSKSDHVYFKLVDNSDGRISSNSMFYVRLKELVDLFIKDPSLYTLDIFMFFLHITGLSVPQQHMEYNLNEDNPVEGLIKRKVGMTPFELAIRGFAKSDKSKNTITSVCTCEGIEDACAATLYSLLKLDLVIKKCNNCGKYFIPLRRSDAIYCDRPSPYNPSKTCKEDGSHRTYEEKLKMDSAEKLRRQIYLAKQMRVRRNPDISSYQENLKKWKIDVVIWKAEIKSGLRTSEEFIQWLNDSKKI